MKKRDIILAVVDVRSAYNVGSLLRTADAMAVEKVLLIGITPYPALQNDRRLPHVSAKASWDIHKTALGAEKSIAIEHLAKSELRSLVSKLKRQNYQILALEQTAKAQPLDQFQPAGKIVLLVGNEVHGLDQQVLRLTDNHLAIPMLGAKESLNVAVAAGVALYHLRWLS